MRDPNVKMAEQIALAATAYQQQRTGFKPKSASVVKMSRATPKMRGFAERLIAHEAREHFADAKFTSRFIVFEKIRPHLATLMGNAGFHGLLLRSLALARAESDWLRAIHVNASGSLEGPDETAPQARQIEIAEGETVLLSQLLRLLVAFIGENLTVRLLREVWPELPADELGPESESENEKTK